MALIKSDEEQNDEWYTWILVVQIT